jgi:hypothetical protein
MIKFRGVCRHKDGGFVATIYANGERHYIGIFRQSNDAIQARLDAEMEFFGYHFDRREIEICDGYAKLPLHGQKGKFYGWAVIDIADLELCRAVAWTLDKRGYVVGRPPNCENCVTLHRYLVVGTEKGGPIIDHRDNDPLNNRRANLRPCNASENAKNTKVARNNSSGFKGVSETPTGRYRARIWNENKGIYIGTFITKEAAARAYDAAALELHGDFASPNSRVAAASM